MAVRETMFEASIVNHPYYIEPGPVRIRSSFLMIHQLPLGWYPDRMSSMITQRTHSRSARLNSTERFLLIELLRLDRADRGRVGQLLGEVDWGRVTATAARFAVLPMIAHTLSILGLLEAVPRAHGRVLREALEISAVSNSLLMADSEVVFSALDEACVPAIGLKGVALLWRDYPSPSARHTDDVDILIPPSLARQAEGAILELGYEPIVKGHRTAIDGSSMREFLAPYSHEEWRYVSPSGSVVDLHRALPGRHDATDEDFFEQYERAEELRAGRAVIRVPSRSDLAQQLSEHVFGHHLAQLRFVPRHLADLGVLYVHGADLTSSSRTDRLSGYLSDLFFAAAFQTGQSAVTRAVRELIFPSEGLDRSAERTADGVELGRRLAFDLKRRPWILWYRLFPVRRHMAEVYGIPPSSPRILTCYLTRWLSSRQRGG